MSLTFEVPFHGGWEDAVDFASRWMNAPDLEQHAAAVLKRHLERAAPALINPYSERLSEDYFVFHLRPIADDAGRVLTAASLLEHCADSIAQIVRGEHARFLAAEQAEILESQMSYYETDSIAQLSDKSSSLRRPLRSDGPLVTFFRAPQRPP